MALGAAKCGAIVVLADVDQDALESKSLKDTLAPYVTQGVRIDIADFTSCDAGLKRCLDLFGRLDVLVNNAGRGPNFVSDSPATKSLKFWEADPLRWGQLIQTNVVGTFNMAHCAARQMISQGTGRIINVSTSLATMYRPEGSPYGVSKAAIETATMIWARDLAGHGITVNALLPGGAVDTDFVSPATREAARSGKTTLLDPQIMVEPMLWLASDASAGFSGARLVAAKWDRSAPLADRIQNAVEEPILRGSQSLKSGDQA
jgi:3-oxoacyl-[acyl-carrier protein] reductase